MKWQDVFETKETHNVRGESCFDVFHKATNEMIACDIPAEDIEKWMSGMVKFLKRIGDDELESILSEDEPE